MLRMLRAAVLCGAVLCAQENSPAPKPVPPKTQFITVDDNVKLEVIDWGGTGRPLILLAGLGGHASGFGTFAPKLTPSYHVFSITRRGFAPSSIPASGYSADRLGDDVVAVIDALKLVRPVLAGHSIAGEELSSVGTRYPKKISGLIYLDAGYQYALYDRVHGNFQIDLIETLKELEQLKPGKASPDSKPVIDQLLQTLPQLEKDLESEKKKMDLMSQSHIPAESPPALPISTQAILAGQQKYTDIHVPILAIFAVPHDLGAAFKDNPVLRAKMDEFTEQQVEAFERQVPSAHIVRLAHASHLIFQSNEADVLREMNAFIGRLP